MEENTRNSNNANLHLFFEGWKTDLGESFESSKSYQYAENCRLFSHNGVLLLSSLKGTKVVYSNSNIVKYLGWYAFEDELVIFVKGLKSDGSQDSFIPKDNSFLIGKPFDISIAHNETSIQANTLFDANVQLIEYETEVVEKQDPELVIQDTTFCDISESEIDFSEYFKEIFTPLNFDTCSIQATSSYPHNKNYDDIIIGLKKDNQGNIYSKIYWQGKMNWPMNAKIVTVGVFENNYYKRIYFTEFINSFKQINLKNKRNILKIDEQFETFQNNILLEPIINDITLGGGIKAMSVTYAYRLYAEDGQTTEFSSFSEMVRIIENDDPILFEGAGPAELTNKKVIIKCNVINDHLFDEIECFAIEYEAKNAPTNIVTLGRKKVNAVNFFTHAGGESFVTNLITVTELLRRKNTWKYCSGLHTKSNQLYASGLRNDPLNSVMKSLKKDFILHGWDSNGNSHNCLFNPDPEVYRFIKPNDSSKYYYVKKKQYTVLMAFGRTEIRLTNKNTEDFITITFENENLFYEDLINFIWEWLEEEYGTELNPGPIQTLFPNLAISNINDTIIFSLIDENIETDLSQYSFDFDHKQIIEDFDEEVVFINLDNSGTLIHGAQSLGYNQGNGIRITYRKERDLLMTAAQDNYPEETPLAKTETPSLRKGFMKGEFYRLGLNLFDNNGYQIFTISLGDIMIPKLGDTEMYIDDNGNVVITGNLYKNSFVAPIHPFNQPKKLYGERIMINLDVRIGCEYKRHISMVQLSYVERTEQNRTILCQGISAPMERINPYKRSEQIPLNPYVANKWCLPQHGGPVYDKLGLAQYDNDPYYQGNDEEDNGQWEKRITVHRSLFYFDSPDIVAGQISSFLIDKGKVSVVGKLNTDHDLDTIVSPLPNTFPNNGRFSRKIDFDYIEGSRNNSDNPWFRPAGVPADGEPYNSFVNFSVFSQERLNEPSEKNIEHARELNDGQIISGGLMGLPQDVSNNSLTLGHQNHYYHAYSRRNHSGSKGWLFKTANWGKGKRTVVIKTNEDIFTNTFISETPIQIEAQLGNQVPSGDPYSSYLNAHSTHALINIKVNSKDSIYGGRNESSYENNIYIPLSKTIPILKETNNIQNTIVEGDTYVSLYFRQKLERMLDLENANIAPYRMNNGGGSGEPYYFYNDSNSWFYGVVLETQVESRLNHNPGFWKESGMHNISKSRNEFLNEAYYQTNNLRKFLPEPFKFQDDPDLNNIIAVSKIKMNGDFIDNWSDFPVNNFYELEKNKGTIFNLVRDKNELYAIQKKQTNLLITDPRTMIPSESGEIAVQQGDGTPIADHRTLSEFGTGIRRSIIENENGFNFFDENRFEFVKIDKPLLIQNLLSLSMRERFKEDSIIDIEGWYDEEFKESNLRIRTENNQNFVLSYNEAFQVFNGVIKEYDSDLFPVWNTEVFAPKKSNANLLEQLNIGPYLEFFGVSVTMKIGVICNQASEKTKIFKTWLGVMNIPYAVKQITVKTSTGQNKTILGNHHRYQIKEGKHHVPLKNQMDWADLRGEWMYLEVEIEKLTENKIDVTSFINFVRDSYQ